MNHRSYGAFALAVAIGGTSPLLAQEAPPAPPRPVPQRPSGPIEVNGIAAKVNGRVVTKNQVSFMLARTYAELVAQFPRRGAEFERQFTEAKARAIQELVDRQIILDEFKQLGASIKPNIIEEEIKQQIRKDYGGNEIRFREALKSSRLTMDGFRTMTRERMVVEAMRQQQFADAPPPLPNEINREYAEVKLNLRDTNKDAVSFQKIFIPRVDSENPISTPETQLSLTEDLAKQLQNGGDFSELAKTYSKDAFADQGGVQSDVPRLDLSAEFAAIIFGAPEGQIIGPLEDPQGFTVVKVIKKSYGPSPSLSEVRELIEQSVRRKKTSAQYDKWIESRRKKAMIDIKMD